MVRHLNIPGKPISQLLNHSRFTCLQMSSIIAIKLIDLFNKHENIESKIGCKNLQTQLLQKPETEIW